MIFEIGYRVSETQNHFIEGHTYQVLPVKKFDIFFEPSFIAQAEKLNIGAILSDPLLEIVNTNAEEWVFGKLPTQVLSVKYLAGVTDNPALVAHEAIMWAAQLKTPFFVSSGQDYYFYDSQLNKETILKYAQGIWANPLIHQIQVMDFQSYRKNLLKLSKDSSSAHPFEPVAPDHELDFFESYELAHLSDQDLVKLNKSKHWALSLEELKAIINHYKNNPNQLLRSQKGLGPNITDVEIEVLAQTWSEHCKHKIFRAMIDYQEDFSDLTKHSGVTSNSGVTSHSGLSNEDSNDLEFKKLGSIKVDGVFNTYIKSVTQELMPKKPWLISVFTDNAGIVRFEDVGIDLCLKVETHNSPSALDPYGGALTGILGVQRDILGTGLGAKPIANTNVFCLAPTHLNKELPLGLKTPTFILNGVHRGVQDGGNKMGIPTVNGAFYFDSQYAGKPLVYCGTLGMLPSVINGQPSHLKIIEPGDYIVMCGGKIGKDGIHGATLSSLELDAQTPVTMVQLGDPLTQRRMHDFILKARDLGLYRAITDNGAGGLSSSIGEMAQLSGGASVHLEKAPLKYPGLKPYEIFISESQERMSLAVAPEQWAELQKLAQGYLVEISHIGYFNQSGYLEINYHNQCVGLLELEFLHEGLPQMQLQAVWKGQGAIDLWTEPNKKQKWDLNLSTQARVGVIQDYLVKALAHQNVKSPEHRVRAYDHEVGASTSLKSFSGVTQIGPQDAAVQSLHLYQDKNPFMGVALSNGLAPHIAQWDSYQSAQYALDEAVRALVAVGADFNKLALLDNFCWPDPLPGNKNPDAQNKLAHLVRASKGLYDLAKIYEAPFISGKDSMKNDFIGHFADGGEVKISALPTVLVTGMAHVEHILKTQSSEFKCAGDKIYLIGHRQPGLAGSVFDSLFEIPKLKDKSEDQKLATVFAEQNKWVYQQMGQAYKQGLFQSVHDVSTGGLLVTLVESCLGSGLGAELKAQRIQDLATEAPGLFVITVTSANESRIKDIFNDKAYELGQVIEKAELTAEVIDFDLKPIQVSWSLSDLEMAYKGDKW